MNIRSGIAAVMLAAALLASLSSSVFAHCWTCLYDSGVGQWYCQSVAGIAAGTCVPVQDEMCNLGTIASCDYDGCSCQRYPAIKLGKKPLGAPPSSVGILLFRGATPDQHRALLASLSESPKQWEIGDAVVTPSLAVQVIVAGKPELLANELELAGYTAVTKRGFATSRILGEGNKGMLVDARLSRVGQNVRISRLNGETKVESTSEMELLPHRALLCKVRIGESQFACVIWARTAMRGSEGVTPEHDRFTNAAQAYPTQNIAKFSGDSPDIGLFDLGPAPGSTWGSFAAYYR